MGNIDKRLTRLEHVGAKPLPFKVLYQDLAQGGSFYENFYGIKDGVRTTRKEYYTSEQISAFGGVFDLIKVHTVRVPIPNEGG